MPSREREGKTDMMDMSRYSVDYETCCMYIPDYLPNVRLPATRHTTD